LSSWSTLVEITANDEGVHVRRTVGFNRCRAPRKKGSFDQAIKRHKPQQAAAHLLHRQRGRKQQPIREQSVGRRHGPALGGRTRRQLFDRIHHQQGGRVSRIRKSEQVTQQHREHATRDQEHANAANDSKEQFQTVDAALSFCIGEQDVPRFGGIVQDDIDII